MQLPRLKEWRESRGLLQKELASGAGLSDFTITRIEGGDSIRPSTARKVADALGVSVADLIERPPVPLGEAPEDAGLTDEEIKHLIKDAKAAHDSPVAASTISSVKVVCDGIEYRIEQSTYTLEGALHDRALVLSALRQYRSLKRSVFTISKNVAPGQREVLEQLEDRLKEVRTKQGEIYEKLWEAESDPDNVVLLVERLNIPELERETEEPSAESGA